MTLILSSVLRHDCVRVGQRSQEDQWMLTRLRALTLPIHLSVLQLQINRRAHCWSLLIFCEWCVCSKQTGRFQRSIWLPGPFWTEQGHPWRKKKRERRTEKIGIQIDGEKDGGTERQYTRLKTDTRKTHKLLYDERKLLSVFRSLSSSRQKVR